MSLSFKALLTALSHPSVSDDPPPLFKRAAPRPPRRPGLRFLPAGPQMRANLAHDPCHLPYSARGNGLDPNDRPS